MFTIFAEPSRMKTQDYVLSDLWATPMQLRGAADFLLSCEDDMMLAVLHMSVRDILEAISTDSLMPRCVKLRQVSEWAYLIISGNAHPNKEGKVKIGNDVTTRWGWSSYQGALLSVQEIGVHLLTTGTAADLPDTLDALGKRKRGEERVRPVRDALFVGPGDDLLYAIPGIGEVKLGRLLRQVGSPAWALAALTNDAFTLDGFGKTELASLRKATRETLGLLPNEQLTVDVVEVQP